MKMINNFTFASYLLSFNKQVATEIDELREKDTKVSSYNNLENIKTLAKIMNLYAYIDEMNAMKDLEESEELEDRIRQLMRESTIQGPTQQDLVEAEQIFREMANDPEKSEQPITEDIIREAYSRYHRNFKKEQEKKEAEKNEPNANENDEAVNVNDWETVKKPNNGPEYSTRGYFDTVYQKLKQARNFTSSSQYDELLTMVKKMNESDNFKGSEVLDDEQKCVIRLLAIKSRINTYLKHKAVDGVKQNSYKKLAAVEELNQLVSDRLSEMKFDPFEYGDRTISKNSLPITYEQEAEALKAKVADTDREGYAPSGYEDDTYYEQDLRMAGDRYPNATWQEMKNVDYCMCRIIIAARANNNVTDDAIRVLEEQRETFRTDPGVKIVPEAVDDPVRGL